MGKPGGPCQGPGGTDDSICGVTEISDKSDWRKSGKFKPEHADKWCCTKRLCRITHGVIADPKAAKQEAAPAPAPAAGSGLPSLLDAAGTALGGGGAPPAAAAAAAPATAAAAAPQSAAAPQAGIAPAAAPPTESAAAAPPPPHSVPPARTPLERQRDLLDTLKLPDGWCCGVAELPSGPHVYFWPSALAEQRWTTWRSPLDAPALRTAFKLEGHQEITKDDDSVVDEWQSGSRRSWPLLRRRRARRQRRRLRPRPAAHRLRRLGGRGALLHRPRGRLRRRHLRRLRSLLVIGHCVSDQ